MKNEILEEINRMKVLGGIINESTGPTNIIPTLIAKITRTSLDDAILNAFEVLEQRGVIAIDDVTKTLTKIEWQRLTDNELKLLFSAQPLRDALEDVATRAGIDITSPAQKVTFKGNFKRIVKGYDDAAGNVISGGRNSGGSNIQPAPGPRPSGTLNLNPDESLRKLMDQSIADTARKDAKALSYYNLIETFGLSESVERAMKYQYSTLGNLTGSELLVEANKLSRQLDQKKYGWLMRLGAKVAEDPTKTVKVGGKTFLQGLLYYGAISLAFSGLALTFAFRDKIMNYFGMGSGNQQNTNTGNMGDVDWNKYKPANN
jgi:hypothetical protein